jgi:co-chaperonin GroES (HSP10)
MSETTDVYKEAQEEKKKSKIDLLKAKPEGWTEHERRVYKDLTLIDFLATNRYVFVRELEYKAETESGIMLVQTEEDKPLTMGMAVSIAPDCRFGIGVDGGRVPAADIKAGDIVSYAVYNGTEYLIGGERFFLVRDHDIFGKVPDSTVAAVFADGDRTDHLWTIRAQMTYDKDNPNNIGPKSSLHVDNWKNKKQNEIDKANEGGGVTGIGGKKV